MKDPLLLLAYLVIIAAIIGFVVRANRRRSERDRRFTLFAQESKRQQEEYDLETARIADTEEADRIRRAEGAGDKLDRAIREASLDPGGVKTRAAVRLNITRGKKKK